MRESPGMHLRLVNKPKPQAGPGEPLPCTGRLPCCFVLRNGYLENYTSTDWMECCPRTVILHLGQIQNLLYFYRDTGTPFLRSACRISEISPRYRQPDIPLQIAASMFKWESSIKKHSLGARPNREYSLRNISGSGFIKRSSKERIVPLNSGQLGIRSRKR